ncbi:hypothetical protein [Pseudomonas akapageensis]|uniref:hypothetical protein n=1 Tax=Pseudomonas akapageensis TaxID=2609961 RepID=UPI0014093AD1|nr:hypothetical protein [Pseudomonas akapageensis]
MRIMSSRNKFGRPLVFILLAFTAVGNVFAGVAASWVGNKDGQVRIEMADGSDYGLKLFSDVQGVYYDKSKHQIEGSAYVSVFQVSPSNPGKPEGFCGAGSEVWLYVYKVAGTNLSEQTRVLVSSCLRSISMNSQNSGEDTQDADFSSVQWHAQGFSIEWFENVDAAGRSLSSTKYVLRDNVFLPLEVLNKESPNE